MESAANVMEYKCPCCSAALRFDGKAQQLTCDYCENIFELEAVQAFHEQTTDTDEFFWEAANHTKWDDTEQKKMRLFTCPSCAGELITDENTAATFCPFCESPTILPGRLSGGVRPDALLPFRTTKEEAQGAFLKLCKGKPLLAKFFTEEQRVEKITGIYVPFWLYDCNGQMDGSYKATRVHSWSDANYRYTKTDHYFLRRGAKAKFIGIPMDGSSKMEDSFMESIEPFDYGEIIDFDTAYLSGFFADKYDVPSEQGESRIRQRVDNSMKDLLQSSFLGYATVVPTSRQLKVDQSKARYVLLPVWILNTRYKDKIYTFAMNGQTGKMTGEFPICPQRTAMWFSGIFAAVTLLVSLVQMLL